MKITVKEAHNLNLSQCYDIKANQYRSKNNHFDYYPEQVDARIIELESLKAEREAEELLGQYEELCNMVA